MPTGYVIDAVPCIPQLPLTKTAGATRTTNRGSTHGWCTHCRCILRYHFLKSAAQGFDLAAMHEDLKLTEIQLKQLLAENGS